MERGAGDKTAIQEIKDTFGIDTYPIVTVKDIIRCLLNTPVDGRIYIDDAMAERMKAYMKAYCV
jgi:orotate phosphoribosyltransferase